MVRVRRQEAEGKRAAAAVSVYLGTMKTLCATLVAALFAVAVAGAQATKFNLTGNWTAEVQTDGGGGSPSFTFTQDGTTLTGKYKGQLGETDLTGTVTGTSVKFTMNIDAQGTALAITYQGEIESDSAMKGTVDLGGMGSGTFTAKRVK